ncbi:MAG TPA: hypothetical protein VGH28_17550 [Polyangiaceae bacterium]|jgi:hypothetical protein
MRIRDTAEWVALAGAAALLVFAGRAFAAAYLAPPAPIDVHVRAPPAPPNPKIWEEGEMQALALSWHDGLACWREADGAVRVTHTAADSAPGKITTFRLAGAVVGPVPVAGADEACWFASNTLRCASPASDRVVDVATAANSVVEMAADARGVVWTQFDGVVAEVTRGVGKAGTVRTLAKLRYPDHVVLDGDTAYVVTLGPLRIVRVARGDAQQQTLFERAGVNHAGLLLADRDALYLDMYDRHDAMGRILRIAKRDGAVTTLYEGFAHVALATIHGDTLYAVSAPETDEGQWDLDHAAVVTLPARGGPISRVRLPAENDHGSTDLVIGWGGSIALTNDSILFTRAPRNPVGAPGPIWQLEE